MEEANSKKGISEYRNEIIKDGPGDVTTFGRTSAHKANLLSIQVTT